MHSLNLTSIGMVVNQSKTEVMLMDKNAASLPKISITLDDSTVLTTAPSVKALGVWFDHCLRWDRHINELKKRVLRVINGLKIIRRKLTFKQAVTLVTAQVLSIVYYASSAWLTPAIGKKELAELEKIHFKALRVVVRDHRQRMSRDLISTKTNRLTPRIWCKFACASALMNIWMSGNPTTLRDTAFQNTYTNERHVGLIYGFDASNTRIGKQITKNWCGAILSQIKVPWSTSLLNKDRIRTLLKTTFYPYNLIPFDF